MPTFYYVLRANQDYPGEGVKKGQSYKWYWKKGRRKKLPWSWENGAHYQLARDVPFDGGMTFREQQHLKDLVAASEDDHRRGAEKLWALYQKIKSELIEAQDALDAAYKARDAKLVWDSRDRYHKALIASREAYFEWKKALNYD